MSAGAASDDRADLAPLSFPSLSSRYVQGQLLGDEIRLHQVEASAVGCGR